MAQPIKISIIIVNYNVRHFLEQCLWSVFRALEHVSGEVIVVDNNSRDDSVPMLERIFADKITLIANKHNPGFSAANNQGIAIAKGEYVLLLNPDTVVGENSLARSVAFMDAHADAGGLGIKMIDGQGIFLPESKRALPTPWVSFYKIFGFSALFPNNKTFAKYHLTYLSKDQNHEIEILSGAYMLMRKALLDNIGYLDEAFFMYGEDVDLSYRILLAGYKNYYLADAPIIHYKGESTKKGSLNYVRVFYQAMIIFAQKHFAGGSQRSFIFFIRLAVWLRAVLAVLYRLVTRFGFALLESVLIFGLIQAIRSYWEHYVKYIEGGYYPPTFNYIAAPLYVAVFSGLLWFLGAYRKPYRIRPLVLATFSGFVGIATVSYLFPAINFSRAIVGLTSVFTLLMTLTTRGIVHLRHNGNFFFVETKRKRVLIVAEKGEAQQIRALLLAAAPFEADIVAEISPEKADITQAIAVYGVNEVIFAAKNLTNAAIIGWMEKLKDSGVSFKILPLQGNFLVGSQEIISPENIPYSLTRPESVRQKRALDVVFSMGMLATSPLLLWAYQRPLAAMRTAWRVLRGSESLVGYPPDSQVDSLPKLLPASLSLADKLPASTPLAEPQTAAHFYARYYTWTLDAEILLRAWRRIGVLSKETK